MRQALALSLMISAFAASAHAEPWWARGAALKPGMATDDFLSPDQAFKARATQDGRLIKVHWDIAEGYYLYRSRFDIKPESPDFSMEPSSFPAGINKTDEYLGSQEIYKNEVEAIAGFTQSDAGAHPLQVKVTYQGCAEAGLCYPPVVKILSVLSGPGDALPANAGAPLEDQRAVYAGIAVGAAAFFAAGLWLRRGRDPRAL